MQTVYRGVSQSFRYTSHKITLVDSLSLLLKVHFQYTGGVHEKLPKYTLISASTAPALTSGTNQNRERYDRLMLAVKMTY